MGWSTTGTQVDTSHRKASSVAYSANGLILRQVEEVEETRWRGMTQTAAEGKLADKADTTTTTIYYKQIGSSSDYAAVGITTGSKTDVVAARSNEADGWEVVETTTTFTAEATDGWSTTVPSGASTGVEVSRDKRSSFVFCESGDSLYAREETVVKEYRYLTQAQAAAKVTELTTDNTTYSRIYHTGVALTSRELMTGTNSSASSRYVDAEHGYTVTQTSTTHTFSGTNWHT